MIQLAENLVTAYTGLGWTGKMRFQVFIFAACAWQVSMGADTSLHLNRDGPETFTDIVGDISDTQLHFSLKLYKAVANSNDGPFAVDTMSTYLELARMYFGAEGLCRQQLGEVLDYPSNRYANHQFQSILYMKSLEFAVLRDFGASMNNKMFHAYDSNLTEFIKEKYDSVYPPPEQLRSWAELTSGNAMYEWAMKAGIDYPYRQKFEGSKSLVLGSTAMFTWNLALLHGNNTDGSYWNPLSNMRNGRWLYVTSAKVTSGQIKYRRYSDGVGDVDATAKYFGFMPSVDRKDLFVTFMLMTEANDNITTLEEKLDKTMIHEIVSNTNFIPLNLSLPQDLGIDSAYDLTEPLKNMGLTEMFKETNNIPNISETDSLKVGAFLHQIKIHHDWNLSGLSDERETGIDFNYELLEFDVPAFIILSVHVDHGHPFILYMGRHVI